MDSESEQQPLKAQELIEQSKSSLHQQVNIWRQSKGKKKNWSWPKNTRKKTSIDHAINTKNHRRGEATRYTNIAFRFFYLHIHSYNHHSENRIITNLLFLVPFALPQQNQQGHLQDQFQLNLQTEILLKCL